MCENCGIAGQCCVCGHDHDVMRWADDGGRVVETEAESVPSVARSIPVESDLPDWVVFWCMAVGGTLWLAGMVFALVMHATRRW